MAAILKVYDSEGNPVPIPAIKGEKGDKGDKGDTGAKGDKGDKGDRGEQGAAGTLDHSELTNRGAAAQHPISAIDGLSAALDGKLAASHGTAAGAHSNLMTVSGSYLARGIYFSDSEPSGTIPEGCIWAVCEAST